MGLPERLQAVLNNDNASYLLEVYRRYIDHPASCDDEWKAFFESLEDQVYDLDADTGPSWAKKDTFDGENLKYLDPQEKAPSDHIERALNAISPSQARLASIDSIRALMLIRNYRVRGHLMAQLDPLKLETLPFHSELDPKTYGFEPEDMDRPIFIDHVLGLEFATMNDIMDILQKTYCGSIGVEFMHIQHPDQKRWIQERIESIRNATEFTERGKTTIMERLVESEGFENYLHTKYVGTKRFGLDGGEALIPALEQVLKRGSQMGVEDVIIGMPHRGRLNVLANVMNKPYQAIFSEFQGNPHYPEDFLGSGDVKYHLGASADCVFDDKKIHMSLTANPSHLESVNTVVLGKVRAKQARLNTQNKRSNVLGILLHGDAAFAGQGLVWETFDLSGLKGYRTGGTIHLIVNNQIGFTTRPSDSRSSPYCSDVAKGVQAPIFHVNGDDPEAVVHVARIATEFRQEFGQDVVIDMWCYRRFGHNEGDEPSFTHPKMYATIAKHPTTAQIYGDQLIKEGVYTADQVAGLFKKVHSSMDEAFKASQVYCPDDGDWLQGLWYKLGADLDDKGLKNKTAIGEEMFDHIASCLSHSPEEMTLNKKIERFLKQRRQSCDSGKNFDWSMGEALAFGSLLMQGFDVRLSGQDSQRGTFSQRHAKLIDQKTEARYTPLRNLDAQQAHFEVLNSPLSEFGVLGFEYGYTLAEPNALVLWEAQFGDFANGAQVIFDQFISSGESKWRRMCGLVILLPHGYEGQGPEHSSARPERYLQLCAQDNMQVCNMTTPANYFHALRRQMVRDFRKPLIIFTPKSLLRHKLCVSDKKDFLDPAGFQKIIDDAHILQSEKVERLILCTGKVYYDLHERRLEDKINNCALIRLEQLYPFPHDELKDVLEKYTQVKDVIWCQEEPENMGYWSFCDRRIEKVLSQLKFKARRPEYVGRQAAASPATGLLKTHLKEQKKLIEQALNIE